MRFQVESLQIQPDFEEAAKDALGSEKRHINMWSMFLPDSKSKELNNADPDSTRVGPQNGPRIGNRNRTDRCSLRTLQEEATLPLQELKSRYGIPSSPARNYADVTSPDYIPLDCGDAGPKPRIFETAAVLKRRISNAGNKIRKRRGGRSKRAQAPSPEAVPSPSLMTGCVSGPTSNPPSSPAFNPPTGPSFNPPSGPRFGPSITPDFAPASGPTLGPGKLFAHSDSMIEQSKASATVEQLQHSGKPTKRVRFDLPAADDDLTPNCIGDNSSKENPGTSVSQASTKKQRAAAKEEKLLGRSKILGGRIDKASRARLKGETKATWKGRLAALGVVFLSGATLDNTVKNFRIVIQDSVRSVQFATSLIEAPRTSGESSAAVALGPRIVFYTDGSHKSRTLGGGAAVTYRRCMPEPTDWIDASASVIGTINAAHAELLAIGLALNISRHEIIRLSRDATAQHNTWPTIFVVTDSQMSLQWIQDYLLGKAINTVHLPQYQQIANSLGKLESLGVKVEFHWTKGHSTVQGNIRADMIAGIASSLMQNYVRKNGWKAPLAMNQYYVRIAIGTSLDVLGMFEAHNEDIALLLGGLPENKHTEALVVSNEPPRTQLSQEKCLLARQGSKGNVVKTLWYKIISPMEKLVHNITGHKRKHSDLSDSDSKVMELGMVVDALRGTNKALPDIPKVREDLPSSQTKALPAVPITKALPDTSNPGKVLPDVRDFGNWPDIPKDTANSLLSRAKDLPDTSIVKTLPPRPVFLNLAPTTRAQLQPGAPDVKTSSDTADAKALSERPVSQFSPRTREQSQPNPPQSTTTPDAIKELFSVFAVPDKTRATEFSLAPREIKQTGTSVNNGQLASPQEKVEAKVEVIDLTRDSLEDVSDANRVTGTIGEGHGEKDVNVDYVIRQENGREVIDLT